MSKRGLIQIVVFVGICLFSFIGVFLLDTDNPQRLHNEKYFENLKAECISVLKSHNNIGAKQDQDIQDRKEIGPLPEGKFISSYHQEGTGVYESPYYYKYESTDPYTAIESYYDYYGNLRYRYTTKYERRTHWATAYKDVPYPYSIVLTIYDISEQMTLFESEDSLSQRMMKEFETKIVEYNHWRFDPIEYKEEAWHRNYGKFYVNRLDALSYETKSQDGIKTLRSIYFANKKAYVLEVKSNYDTTKLANNYLANLTTLDLYSYNSNLIIKIFACILFASLLIIIFVYLNNSIYWKMPIINNHAKRLFKYSLYMSFINLFVTIFVFYWLFTNDDYQLDCFSLNCIDLKILAYLLIATLVIMDLLICTSLYAKQKKEYRYDYLIQDNWQLYFDKRLDNVQEKKTLVSFLYYPLFILGPLPLGILSLVYVIPFGLIILIAVEIRHIYRWINNDVTSDAPATDIFLDYYVVLDLKREASPDEVEKASNSAMARYNSANGNPLYGKEYFNRVQEAFAVLSSTNQLRPDYDEEYETYKASNSECYSFSNKQLEKEILSIRNKLYNVKPIRSKRTINIVIVSFAFLIVITFIILRLLDFIPPIWEDNSYTRISGRFAGKSAY